MEFGGQTSALGQWRTVQRAAHPRLRTFVHGYFASTSSLRRTVRELHLPATEVPLFLNFGARHRRLAASGSDDWTAWDGAWVVGLHDRQHVTEAAGERRFMIVRFTPVGAHLFLRLPMHLIANRALDLASIDPALERAVKSRLGAARSWPDRFAAMDALIAERVADDDGPSETAATWRRLVAAGGRVAIASLAADMNCSHRALVARFRTQVGFPPKTIARLLRFNGAMRALDRLSRRPASEPAGTPYIEADQPGHHLAGCDSMGHLAADCGYFDQAHLIKEFRAFAGSAPEAFLRRIAAEA